MSIRLEDHLYPKGKSLTEPTLLPSVLDSDGAPVGFYDDKRKTSQSTVVNLGDSPNSNNGDPLRIAFAKLNNFMEASYWTNESIAKYLDKGFVVSSDSDVDYRLAISQDAKLTFVNTPNEIEFTLNNVDGLHAYDSEIFVRAHLASDVNISNLHVTEHARFDSDVYIQGSLTVNGTTTMLNTQNLEVRDTTIVLNSGQPTPTATDIGLIFQRYDSDTVSALNWNGYLVWDESIDSFVLGETNQSGVTINPNISMRYMEWESGETRYYDTLNTLRLTQNFDSEVYLDVVGSYVIETPDNRDFRIRNATDEIIKVGKTANPLDSAFVWYWNTTDSKWTLGGDGTGQIDGGTF